MCYSFIITIKYYSYLSASTGLSLLALQAGIAPDTIPITTENNNEKNKRLKLNAVVKPPLDPGNPKLLPSTAGNIEDIPAPTNIPIAPPTKPSIPELIKNIKSISLFLAPMAFIIPMSLVFSRTEVNIVFATPILPTRTETAAINPKNRVIVDVNELNVC